MTRSSGHGAAMDMILYDGSYGTIDLGAKRRGGGLLRLREWVDFGDAQHVVQSMILDAIEDVLGGRGNAWRPSDDVG